VGVAGGGAHPFIGAWGRHGREIIADVKGVNAIDGRGC
jgi:hypothetical protein